MTTKTFICTHCAKEYSASSPDVINVTDNPELKDQVISGEIFVSSCPYCGTRQLASHPMVYIDSKDMLIIVMSADGLSAEDTQGYTTRRVGKVGDLIEKVKIFNAGLDDMVIEMCKFVTAQELGKQVDLKFLKMDGADNEIILTYPSKDQMEMISIGFNVYEDCRGIIQRNPAMSEVSSFALIDQAWISSFFA